MRSLRDKPRSETVIFGPYIWELSIVDRNPEDPDPEIGVSVTFYPDEEHEIDTSGSTASEYTIEYDESFHIDMILPQTISSQDKTIIWKQLIEVTRHELEHLSQPGLSMYAARKPSTYYLNDMPTSNDPAATYLLDPNEIPAFIRGLLRRVKSRAELISLIDRELTPKKLSADTHKKVMDTWIRWADQNVHNLK